MVFAWLILTSTTNFLHSICYSNDQKFSNPSFFFNCSLTQIENSEMCFTQLRMHVSMRPFCRFSLLFTTRLLTRFRESFPRHTRTLEFLHRFNMESMERMLTLSRYFTACTNRNVFLVYCLLFTVQLISPRLK